MANNTHKQMSRLNPDYAVRNIAGENLIVQHGRQVGDTTRVIAFNDSSLMLWNAMSGRDFTLDDVVSCLMENYEVDLPTAARDAAQWIETLRANRLIID